MGSYDIGHRHCGNTVTWCDSHSGQTHDKFKTLFYCWPLVSNCRYGLRHGSYLSIFQPGCQVPSIKLKGGGHGRRYPLACVPPLAPRPTPSAGSLLYIGQCPRPGYTYLAESVQDHCTMIPVGSSFHVLSHLWLILCCCTLRSVSDHAR